MKKLLIAMFVLCLGISTMAAAAKVSKAKVVVPVEKWNALDVGIWFGLPDSMEDANVRGLRLGLPISSSKGYVRGVEFSFFCAATDDINGLQTSFGAALAKKLSGLQFSLVNICDNEAKGAQLGIYNCAGKRGWQLGLINSGKNAKFQFGLININKGGLWPFSIILNFGKDTFKSSDEIRAEKCTCTKLPCKKCKGKKKCVCKKAACKVHSK